MSVLVLIIVASFCFSSGETKPVSIFEEFQRSVTGLLPNNRELQYLTQICPTKEPENIREEEEYDFGPLEINQCQVPGPQSYKNCEDFDISVCAESCYLGYETNIEGCVISCKCKWFGLFDGDILMTDEDMRMVFGSRNRGASRKLHRWNNIPELDRTYKIPYTFHPSIQKSSFKASRILAAFNDFQAQTCLRFKPRTGLDVDYLEFSNGNGCKSSIGRIGGKQTIYIGYGCGVKGIIIHEIMHALGFFHEHTRPDRDANVRILWRNVSINKLKNFIKLPSSQIDSMGSPYDLNSVLQYSGMSFSKNKKPTMIDRKTNQAVVAQRRGFSEEDVKQINMMYKCTSYLHDFKI